MMATEGIDDHSSKGSTPNSTSMYQYSHEPYESFQSKVALLAHNLADVDTVAITRVRGGSYNRVVRARLEDNDKTVDGVFRIPRFSDLVAPKDEEKGSDVLKPDLDHDIHDQAAVLQLLRIHDIPAPTLLAFDATINNDIGLPYVFQEFCDGRPLDLEYGNMCLSEKLSIAESLAELMLAFEKVTFTSMGTLQASTSLDRPFRASYLSGHDESLMTTETHPFDLEGEYTAASGDISVSLADFLCELLQTHHRVCLSLDRHDSVADMWPRLCEISKEMLAAGFYDSTESQKLTTKNSILYHWDLMPRNILVRRINDQYKSQGDADEQATSQSRWEIAKVIDWDKVQVLPALLTRKPPVWLWDFSDDIGNASISSGYDDDADLLRPSRYADSSERLSDENRQIKKAFEERLTIGLKGFYDHYDADVYHEEAYGKGRWLRRLARFAIEGVSDNEGLKRYEHFEKEWSALRLQYGKEEQARKENTALRMRAWNRLKRCVTM